jgi:hypothetical protein
MTRRVVEEALEYARRRNHQYCATVALQEHEANAERAAVTLPKGQFPTGDVIQDALFAHGVRQVALPGGDSLAVL